MAGETKVVMIVVGLGDMLKLISLYFYFFWLNCSVQYISLYFYALYFDFFFFFIPIAVTL